MTSDMDMPVDPKQTESVVMQYGAGLQFGSKEYVAAVKALPASATVTVMLHDLGGAAYPGPLQTTVRIARGAIRRLLGRGGSVATPWHRRRAWCLLQKVATTFVVCYPHERDRLSPRLQERCVVVDHPTPPRAALPDRAAARMELDVADAHVVTLLGFLSPRKGVREALDLIGALGDDAVLVLAGAPVVEFAEELDRMIASTRGRVIHTGWLETAEQRKWIAATDVAIAPFRDASASGSMLEWLVQGIPVVTSATPLAEQLRQRTDGLLTTYDDEEGLQRSVRAALSGADEHRRAKPLDVPAARVGERVIAEAVRNRGDLHERIFLVGCPRSGTTLLQSMLAAHPGLVSFPETHAFRNRARANDAEAVKAFSAALSDEVRAVIEPELDAVDSAYVPPQTLVHAGDLTVMRTAADGWLEKTPDHLLFAEQIASQVPGSRFVHIVRDPVDVVSSLRRLSTEHPTDWTRKFQDLDAGINRWTRSGRAHKKWVGDPAHFFVSYETLVASPESVLRTLCSWLELEYDPEMTSGFARSAESLIAGHEPWKAKNTRELTAERKSVLTDAEEEAVRQACHPLWREILVATPSLSK
ncbi:sulfotransferase [Microbacterium sp. G2-8]|uniref:sulfotransferase n=1 Tax=Microbacterium sp. G2-8 TaxID=2842454 RepID=UPI001C89BF98|nr:sulfotransferase [Microbacterium sp. G2-8]